MVITYYFVEILLEIKIKLHECTKLHKDNFALKVSFTRVTFLHESKKKTEKNIYNKKTNRKKKKDELIKKQKKMLLTY